MGRRDSLERCGGSGAGARPLDEPLRSSGARPDHFRIVLQRIRYIVDTLDTVCAAAREVDLSFEVIVIDDGARDNSRELVRDYIVPHPKEHLMLRANRVNKASRRITSRAPAWEEASTTV